MVATPITNGCARVAAAQTMRVRKPRNSREHRDAHYRQLPLRRERVRNRGRDSRTADTLYVFILRQTWRAPCVFSAAPIQADDAGRQRYDLPLEFKLVAHNFCPSCGCAVFSDSPAFQPDGTWDGTTRRYAVNPRLFDDFDAAEAPVTVIDGKNLW